MHIIQGSHCLPKFSLAYRKEKLHTSWFSISLIKQTTQKECVISTPEYIKSRYFNQLITKTCHSCDRMSTWQQNLTQLNVKATLQVKS